MKTPTACFRLNGQPFQGDLARVQANLLGALERINHAMTFGPDTSRPALTEAIEHAELSARLLRRLRGQVHLDRFVEANPPPPPDNRLNGDQP